jgi:hypothetical protein
MENGRLRGVIGAFVVVRLFCSFLLLVQKKRTKEKDPSKTNLNFSCAKWLSLP